MLNLKFKREIKKKAPSNYSEINLIQQEEVNWWCEELSCTEEELINAINKVGDYTSRIKEYLGRY
ncbi:DUF3606 domain-containing protein [Clostridium arbusti]|jgi:hypothetical protein|uniref:DUF3606 domain-containing protein n=1 Tax=Clostridium arbusti TaxID=1137848 RepID=UPI000289EBF1|nr:DUF3606 domain-containing protein [Clostridium arbusti]